MIFVQALVSALLCMLIGMIWYSPKVFGSAWMRGIGKDMDDMDKPGPLTFLLAIASSVVMVLMLMAFTVYGEAQSYAEYLKIAGALWLGFQFTNEVGAILWEQRSWKLLFINGGYNLVVMLAVASLLYVW